MAYRPPDQERQPVIKPALESRLSFSDNVIPFRRTFAPDNAPVGKPRLIPRG